MISLVETRREEIVAACQRYGVERLDLFGSAAGKDFDPGRSDLAFERREPQNLFDRYFGLKEDLENLFAREVSLVMEGALRKDQRFAAGVDESHVALYAAWKNAADPRTDKELGLFLRDLSFVTFSRCKFPVASEVTVSYDLQYVRDRFLLAR